MKLPQQPPLTSPPTPFRARHGRLLGTLGLCLLSCVAYAQSLPPLKVGVSTPLSGTNAVFGQGLAQGLKAGLGRLNAQGGVDGRAVELVVLDDAGQADRTVTNTRELLAQGVVALTGYHGAPGIEAALSMLDTAGVPMIGVASSAESLRDPPRPWLFNLRAGAAEETAALIYQLDTVGITRVAVVGQADGLGQGTMAGVQHQLTRIAVRPVAMETLPAKASPAALEATMQKVCAAQPAAVVLALAPRPALDAIRVARQAGCRPQFQVLSETGGELAGAASSSAVDLTGLVVAQVLPLPRGTHRLAQEARAELGKQGVTHPDAISYPQLEGYLYGRVLSDALRSCGRRASSACLTSALDSRQMDVAGYSVQFTPNNRKGSSFVELTILDAQGRLRR